jgi:hypothetical protein
MPMSKAELTAILANPISSLKPTDIKRIQAALNTFAHAEAPWNTAYETALSTLVNQFPNW